jgi:hypothetical protein
LDDRYKQSSFTQRIKRFKSAEKIPVSYKYMILNKVFGLSVYEIAEIYDRSPKSIQDGVSRAYAMVITGKKPLFNPTVEEMWRAVELLENKQRDKQRYLKKRMQG